MVNRLTLEATKLIYKRLPYPLDWLKKPIPLRPENAATALDYHGQPVSLDLPLSKEPLVKAADFGLASASYYARTDGKNEPYNCAIPGALVDVWMRESVAIRLVQVNEILAGRGLHLQLYDAYRPKETQQALWDFFIEVGRGRLQTNDPEKLREFAGHYVSEPSGFDPEDSLTWPTHNTGGAVDLTLADQITGKELDMGSGFDQPSEVTFTDHFEGNQGQGAIAARDNRRILYNVMTRIGFRNYPYEWWHFDYGTQMWLQNGGRLSGCTTAWYGPAWLPASTYSNRE